MTERLKAESVPELETRLFLEALHQRYHYDFRSYSRASLTRRIEVAREALNCATISDLQARLLHDPSALHQVIDALTVQVSDLFRDPAYYRRLREEVVPHLKTFPSLKVWIPGCANGEELYSLAILFEEEGLLGRTIFYATEINRRALAKAAQGIYDISRLAGFSANYQAAGGKASLSDYFTAAYGGAAFHRRLRQTTVFSEHDLATDQVFSEVHLVSCRNVLIYFDEALQHRAVGLFADSLVRGGFLGLGAHETLRFSSHGKAFTAFCENERIWRRTATTESRDG